MSKRPHSLLPLVGIVALATSCSLAPSQEATAVRTIEEQARVLTPGLNLTFDLSRTDPPGPFLIHHFSYGFAPAPYGEGFAVSSPKTRVVLWIYLHLGDYPPHEVRWADFDGDGRLDIFFHAGFEDVATTHVYVNRVVADRFGLTQFAPAYENSKTYSVVLDFEGDGRPELLEPEAYPDEFDPCASEFRVFESANEEARNEYRRLAERFDSFNFKFGFDDDEYPGLSLFERIRVKSVSESVMTEPVQTHLRWRLRILRSAQPHVSPGCREQVTRTEAYLEAALSEGRWPAI